MSTLYTTVHTTVQGSGSRVSCTNWVLGLGGSKVLGLGTKVHTTVQGLGLRVSFVNFVQRFIRRFRVSERATVGPAFVNAGFDAMVF